MKMTARALALIFIALALSGCPSSDAKQKALQASLSALNTARDTFVAWDAHHQKGLVDRATSLDEGKKLLTDYRNKRQKVMQGFVVAYSALAAAALEDKLAALVQAAVVAQELYQLIKSLTEGSVDVAVPDEVKNDG